MDPQQLWIGIVHGAYYLPIALGVVLAARHGRYLPLWLPECGMVSAYVGYYLSERTSLPGWLVVSISLSIGVAAALLIHYGIFARHIEHAQPFSALLRGIGVVVVLGNAASLITGDYSLSFHRVAPTTHLDGFVVAAGCAVAFPLWAWCNHTRPGLIYRSVSENRNLAGQYGLHVAMVDLWVMIGAGLLCSFGGLCYGLRYGLVPQMMSTTSLKAIAVIVAVGPESLSGVAVGMMAVGLLESACQASARFSAFEPAVSYAALVVGLLVHYVLSPWLKAVKIRRRWRAAEPTAEATE